MPYAHVFCIIYFFFSSTLTWGQGIERHTWQSPLNPQINAAHSSEDGGGIDSVSPPGGEWSDRGDWDEKGGLKACLCAATWGGRSVRR